ncbi:hypothetical protein HNR46_002966 [Haloferula luteola]|uniref:Uncharacterized protein n=1 Tax=Haloferula luteola TaxID=595692 RepID=A0A840VDL1_9BACT|nr:hypothetical protein [Haloferula luteola]MBB5352718.1 hypothetical protein [Haloferula luteola]
MRSFPRSKPLQPLATVYRTDLPMGELCRHLPGVTRMILRSDGLTVAKITRISALGTATRDPESGLHLHHPEQLTPHLVRCPADATLTCVLRSSTGETPLSLHFPSTPWESRSTRRLLDETHAHPVEVPGIWSEGAGAWLDEGLHQSLRFQAEMLHLLSLLDEFRTVTLHVQHASCSLETTLRPTFIDLDGDLLRLSDRHGHHAVHLHPHRVRAAMDHRHLHLHSLTA